MPASEPPTPAGDLARILAQPAKDTNTEFRTGKHDGSFGSRNRILVALNTRARGNDYSQ
jgi:hypothetical protein